MFLILTKLRTKLLKPDMIALGDYVAAATDLHCLLAPKSKDKVLIRKGVLSFDLT